MEEAHSHCCVPALVDSRRRPRRAGVVSVPFDRAPMKP